MELPLTHGLGSSRIIHGDMREVLANEPEGSVHAVVTDPPYGLSFMGKGWDHQVPGVDYWSQVFRVLKPGGHVLAFGGTRTFHRMACAIEDAGFEMRDTLIYLYGTGFPKSHNLKGEWEGFGTALKPAWEPIIMARKPLIGTVAKNVMEHGTGAINVDACRVEILNGEEIKPVVRDTSSAHAGWVRPWVEDKQKDANQQAKAYAAMQSKGRWPANVVHDGGDEVEAAFSEFGEKTSGKPGVRRKAHETHSMAGRLNITGKTEVGFGDSGSASRFFYSAKASAADRRDSKHPTVKPVSLMRWLVRMVTPPKGIVLDPFAGSGTTGEAAIEEGFIPFLIEREEEYVQDIQRRMDAMKSNGKLL